MSTMQELRYTLLTDGTSDAVLLHHLTWLLRQYTERAIQPTWADLTRSPIRPQNLTERIQLALQFYDCDVLFIHRDAERESYDVRVNEIRSALRHLVAHPTICVVPVRMQEAWLLFDEAAIRRAAGNPHGREKLELPPLAKIETLPNPKQMLHELLALASGLSGRRLKTFSPRVAAHEIGERITDFSPLRRLHAFPRLERDIGFVVKQQGW